MAQVAAKKVLRKGMKQTIKTLSMDARNAQSEQVTQKLVNHPAYKSASRVAIFLSMPDEVDTYNVMIDIFATGKTCYIPRYSSMEDTRMDMVKLEGEEDYDALPVTAWNIKQPALDDLREEALETGGLDLILIPGLAFTLGGARLGRGKGYYDTYLARCKDKQGQLPATLALAFKEQVVDHIPTDDHDVIIQDVLYAD